MTWRDSAACIGLDPLYHGADHEPARARETREAQAIDICRTCPDWVRDACLRDAIDTRDVWGVRGGHTPDQLDTLVRAKRRRKTATAPPAPRVGNGGGRAEHHHARAVIKGVKLA
jgi:WhiB family redox-sensing transcriptional regulator